MNLSSHRLCVQLVTPRELDTLRPHADMFRQVRGLHPFLPSAAASESHAQGIGDDPERSSRA